MFIPVNVRKEVNSVEKLYVYKKIAEMNGHTISVVNVADRTLDFHVHKNSDEMFLVLVLHTQRFQKTESKRCLNS